VIENLILGGAALLAGALGGWVLQRWRAERRRAGLERDKSHLLEKARSEAEQKVKSAELEVLARAEKSRHELEEELNEKRLQIKKVERRLERDEEMIERERERIQVKERSIEEQQARSQQAEQRARERADQLDQKLKAVDQKATEADQKLLEVSQLSEQEARDRVMARFEQECSADLDKYLQKQEEIKKERAEELAQRIVGTAIQRCAVMYTAETVTATIDLPNEEMKGRIIGREGRNIRAIEKSTGVDVIVDDTPGVIVISCFDAVRREVARKSIEKLILDGRIHPSRVDELVDSTRKEIEEDIRQTGKKTVQELKLPKVHPQIQYLVGRLKYRTSYGQNVLKHSIEIAYILSAIASELKLDSQLAKRCGLLHDIGKALTHEVEGSHAVIGAEQAKRFDETRLVWNAIGAHHEDMPYESVYAVLTQVGDAISAGRPGARRDTIERYIERLEKLEQTATSFEGVTAAFALQAGREIRVLVDADLLDDQRTILVAREIAKKIEDELTYPGEIKVTVVRERKIVEVAR